MKSKKVDIENGKVDIQDKKVDIERVILEKEKDFYIKTVAYILRLFENSDVMKCLVEVQLRSFLN